MDAWGELSDVRHPLLDGLEQKIIGGPGDVASDSLNVEAPARAQVAIHRDPRVIEVVHDIVLSLFLAERVQACTTRVAHCKAIAGQVIAVKTAGEPFERECLPHRCGAAWVGLTG